jgi:hypothetical protein
MPTNASKTSWTILQTINLIADVEYEPGIRREPRAAIVGIDAEYAVIPPARS